MNNKKLILLDIDGTLFDNQRQMVSPKSIAAIKQLHNHHIVAIATGRAPFMIDSIKAIKPLIDYYIFINGQYICAHKKTIFQEPLDRNVLKELIKRLQSLNLAYGFESSHQEAVSRIDELVLYSFQNLGLPVPPVDPQFYLHHDVFQAWAFSNSGAIDMLKAEFSELRFIQWMDVGYDILPGHASKGLGMKRLAEYLQMDLKDVIAIGDGDNDFEMVRDAGIGIAMGNAAEKVKRVAKIVTSDVGDDGVYQALMSIGLIK
ncbi:MAG TPA: Cof-type HAD-IIB family hydrolase [Bacilli bacterium]|nr:MAG: putative bifunctional phosphatase/peptidyl-prolyl cis-trans isomerase [Tenericutes bacterium ADurb.BinA124]HNZ50019.1 Cof-type HAD-IIB family hydrolase [Bacilli bacterium]HOH17926.1 Cof-type HAD-IIB family hydrolase [Bacilli bacterium]HPX84379.1 Cof-type HAD-IIB family hydrolase [Bacilli bacterium]HQC73988.1 Cof-type HAD-IIB family hydrolase [Bacilli bacterium]